LPVCGSIITDEGIQLRTKVVVSGTTYDSTAGMSRGSST
jgi:hypothetical protein